MPPKLNRRNLKFTSLTIDLKLNEKKPIDFQIGTGEILRNFSGKKTPLEVLERWIISTESNQPREPFTSDTQMKHSDFSFCKVEEADKGCYGTVFQCRHKDFPNLPLAMKMIQLNTSDVEIQQIKRELKIIKNTNHKNIVTWYGSTIDPIKYGVNILMEYVDGPTLQSAILLGGRFPPDILEYTLKCTVNALKYLKDSLNVAHRDIKPSNIIFSRKGSLKVCDFGMSRIIESTNKSAMASMFVGARSYMSPEMLGDTSPHTANKLDYYLSDIFSLSTTLLECTFGFYPYPMVEPQELKDHLENQKPAKKRPRTNSISQQIESNPDIINQDETIRKTYMERQIEMSPFEVLEMLRELKDTSRFYEFGHEYWSQDYCNLIDYMSLHQPSERVNYENIIQINYFKNINLDEEIVSGWISRILKFH